MGKLDEIVKDLPPDLQKEVEDFAQFLAAKHQHRSRRKPTFGWAGALKDWRDKYTSVELQHKASDWMAGED